MAMFQLFFFCMFTRPGKTRISRIFMIQVTSLVSLHHPGSTQRLVHLFPRDVSLVLSDGATEGVVALRQPFQAAFVHRPIGLEEDHLFLATLW